MALVAPSPAPPAAFVMNASSPTSSGSESSFDGEVAADVSLDNNFADQEPISPKAVGEVKVAAITPPIARRRRRTAPARRLKSPPRLEENTLQDSQADALNSCARQPFPQKLMEMLSKEGVEQPHVVSWLPHGRAFLVKQRKLFTSEIMPKYFRLTKFPSFQRQLNLYGFRMLTKGRDAGAYYHAYFLKDFPERCQDIRRDNNTPSNSGASKVSKSPSPPPNKEPDLYLAPVQPAPTLHPAALAPVLSHFHMSVPVQDSAPSQCARAPIKLSQTPYLHHPSPYEPQSQPYHQSYPPLHSKSREDEEAAQLLMGLMHGAPQNAQ